MMLTAGMAGCTSTKSRCETLCDWINKCAGTTVSCSNSELNECVDNYNDENDSCQDAFDEFADCLDENDKCEDVEKECIEEANKFGDKCAD